MEFQKLKRSFYARDTNIVAKEMLGKLLVRHSKQNMLIGRITEVESYRGRDDLACHASKGRTPRCEVMFGAAGHAYVYLIYGMYNCLNIVTEDADFPAAVLIRALEPIAGLDTMHALRKTEKLKNLTTGPGKLTQALAITRELNNEDTVQSDKIFLTDDNFPVSNNNIVTTTRVGVEYAGKDALLPWRYYLKGSEFISRP